MTGKSKQEKQFTQRQHEIAAKRFATAAEYRTTQEPGYVSGFSGPTLFPLSEAEIAEIWPNG